MNSKSKLTKIFQQLRLSRIVPAFLLATVLLITTVCNSGSELGALTLNPPVQAGGQNNLHKAGGDGMNQYYKVKEPRVRQDRASLSSTPILLAVANQSETTYPNDDRQIEGLLYSNSHEVKSLNSVNDFVSPERQKELLDPTQIPAKKQPNIDRSNPNNKILEKTGQMFKDASNF